MRASQTWGHVCQESGHHVVLDDALSRPMCPPPESRLLEGVARPFCLPSGGHAQSEESRSILIPIWGPRGWHSADPTLPLTFTWVVMLGVSSWASGINQVPSSSPSTELCEFGVILSSFSSFFQGNSRFLEHRLVTNTLQSDSTHQRV